MSDKGNNDCNYHNQNADVKNTLHYLCLAVTARKPSLDKRENEQSERQSKKEPNPTVIPHYLSDRLCGCDDGGCHPKCQAKCNHVDATNGMLAKRSNEKTHQSENE
jgi:hypothetical protein